MSHQAGGTKMAKRPNGAGPARIDPRLILAAIVESCDDAIIGKTLQGVITSWNAGAERVYGYSAEQMVGRSIHQKLDLAPVDVKALLQRAVDNAGVDDRRALGLAVPKALPLVVADADAILQVLANFVSNARKYSPDGGSIRIGARVIGSMVEIHVRDHGLGVPAEDLPNLFQRFYRVDSPDRQSIRGTGLGLAINQRIVEAHGGRVEAHSEGLGKGSVFQFTLPVHQGPAKRADVLIVDEDARFARHLEAELLATGLTALRAGDVETAEHLLLDGMKPRAVVLDIVLSGIQGEGFLTRLGAHNGERRPTVVLTVKDLDSTEIAILERAAAAAALLREAGATQAVVALIVQALGPRLLKC